MRFLLFICSLMVGSSSFAEVGVTDTEIVIGGHTAESGAASYSDTPNGSQAVFDEVNLKGGIHGRKIRYIRIDSQGIQVKSLQAAKKLVEEEKVFVFYMGQGASHQVVYKYLIEKGVPDIMHTDALIEYSKPFQKLIFSLYAPFYNEGVGYGEHITKVHKGKKVCYLTMDIALGEQLIEGTKEGIKEGNSKLSEQDKVKTGIEERVSRDATQANVSVLKMKKEGCDVVVTSTYRSLCPNAINYGMSQDFRPTWYVQVYNVTPTFLKLLPAGHPPVISASDVLPNENAFEWKEYSSLMKKYNYPLSRNTAAGYTAGKFFVDALTRTGKDLTRDKLIATMETMGDWRCGLCRRKKIDISPTNHLMFIKPMLLKAEKGEFIPME